jgi:rare lipoprotein A
MIWRFAFALCTLVLVGCAGPRPKQVPPDVPEQSDQSATAGVPDYVAGGLYKPGVPDGGPDIPPDISGLPEPVPRAEPRARYGNKSPYSVLGKRYYVMDSAEGYVERGIASWYGTKFHGRVTSSFEPYDMYQFTAAHKTLPLPSYAEVTNLDNGRKVIVRVNDRGPFHEGRIIDLSYAAAIKLGIHVRGTGRVEVRAITPNGHHASTAQTPPITGHGSSSANIAPQGSAPIADSERVAVQVGSFRDHDNARRLKERLQGADIRHVDIDSTRVDGGRVHRVRIQNVAGRDLQVLLNRLAALGLSGARVVRE